MFSYTEVLGGKYKPLSLFSIKRFLIDPVKDEYQPLDVKTFTSLNSDGFVFVTEKTFVPPMMM